MLFKKSVFLFPNSATVYACMGEASPGPAVSCAPRPRGIGWGLVASDPPEDRVDDDSIGQIELEFRIRAGRVDFLEFIDKTEGEQDAEFREASIRFASV